LLRCPTWRQVEELLSWLISKRKAATDSLNFLAIAVSILTYLLLAWEVQRSVLPRSQACQATAPVFYMIYELSEQNLVLEERPLRLCLAQGTGQWCCELVAWFLS
jgi:hypothetical protein